MTLFFVFCVEQAQALNQRTWLIVLLLMSEGGECCFHTLSDSSQKTTV